jgi:hypothetical protein
MKTYRIIEYANVVSGTVWALVRQESDDVMDITPISAHSTEADAQLAKAAREMEGNVS